MGLAFFFPSPGVQFIAGSAVFKPCIPIPASTPTDLNSRPTPALGAGGDSVDKWCCCLPTALT